MPVTSATSDDLAPVALHPVRTSIIECSACGYSPDDIVPPLQCPKCLGHRTFRRITSPGSTLIAILTAEHREKELGDWHAPGRPRESHEE